MTFLKERNIVLVLLSALVRYILHVALAKAERAFTMELVLRNVAGERLGNSSSSSRTALTFWVLILKNVVACNYHTPESFHCACIHSLDFR
jgi:hypothetical protein